MKELLTRIVTLGKTYLSGTKSLAKDYEKIITAIIWAYVFTVALVLILYITTWVSAVIVVFLSVHSLSLANAEQVVKHVVTLLTPLLSVMKEIIGSSMVAFITFLIGLFTDFDGDGKPDFCPKGGKGDEGK